MKNASPAQMKLKTETEVRELWKKFCERCKNMRNWGKSANKTKREANGEEEEEEEEDEAQ